MEEKDKNAKISNSKNVIVNSNLNVQGNLHIGDIINIIQNKSKGATLKFQDFISLITKNFQGRETEKEYIKQFIIRNNDGYLIIKGQAGIGKSTLIAQTYAELIYEQEIDERFNDTHFIPYFFQQGTQSSKINNFYQTAKSELDKIYYTDDLVGNNEMDRFSDFLNKLEIVSTHSDKKIVFLIDGIDEIETKLEYLITEQFNNVIVVYSTRPTEKVDDFESENINVYSLVETLELKGLNINQIDELLNNLLNVNKKEEFVNFFPTYQIYDDTNGNPLNIILFVNEWTNGYLEQEKIIKIPRVDNLYKRIFKRITKSGRSIEVIQLLCFSEDGISLRNIERLLNLKDDETIKIEIATKEVITLVDNKLFIFHKSFRDHIIDKLGRNKSKYDELFVGFCSLWNTYKKNQKLEDYQALEYALAHYSVHLSNLCIVEQNDIQENQYKVQLFNLCDNSTYKKEQISFFNNLYYSSQLIERTIQVAKHYNEEKEIINAGISAAQLHIISSTKLSEIANNSQGETNINKIHQKIEYFQPQEQFIIYLSVLHSLLFNNNHSNTNITQIQDILNYIEANLDKTTLNWKKFIPDYYIDAICEKIKNLGLNAGLFDSRQHGENKVNFRFFSIIKNQALFNKYDKYSTITKKKCRNLNLKRWFVKFLPVRLFRYIFNLIPILISFIYSIFKAAGNNILEVLEGVVGLGVLITTGYSGYYIYNNFDIRIIYLILIIIAIFIVSGIVYWLLLMGILSIPSVVVRIYFKIKYSKKEIGEIEDLEDAFLDNISSRIKKVFGFILKFNTILSNHFGFKPLITELKKSDGSIFVLFKIYRKHCCNPNNIYSKLAVEYSRNGSFKNAIKTADLVQKYDLKSSSYSETFKSIIQESPQKEKILFDTQNKLINTRKTKKSDYIELTSYQKAVKLKNKFQKIFEVSAIIIVFSIVIALILGVILTILLNKFAFVDPNIVGEEKERVLDLLFQILKSQELIYILKPYIYSFFTVLAGYIILLFIKGRLKKMRVEQFIKLSSFFHKQFVTFKYLKRNVGKKIKNKFGDFNLTIGILTISSFVIFSLVVSIFLHLNNFSSGIFVFILLSIFSIFYFFYFTKLILSNIYKTNFSFIPPYYIRILFHDNFSFKLIDNLIAHNNLFNAIKVYNRLGNKNHYTINDYSSKKNNLLNNILTGLFICYYVDKNSNHSYNTYKQNYKDALSGFVKLFKNRKFRYRFKLNRMNKDNTLKQAIAEFKYDIVNRISLFWIHNKYYKKLKSPDYIIGIKLLKFDYSEFDNILNSFVENFNPDKEEVFKQFFSINASRKQYNNAFNFLLKMSNRKQLEFLKQVLEIFPQEQYIELIKWINIKIEDNVIRAHTNKTLFNEAFNNKDKAIDIVTFFIENFFKDKTITSQALYAYYYYLFATGREKSEQELISRLKLVI